MTAICVPEVASLTQILTDSHRDGDGLVQRVCGTASCSYRSERKAEEGDGEGRRQVLERKAEEGDGEGRRQVLERKAEEGDGEGRRQVLERKAEEGDGEGRRQVLERKAEEGDGEGRRQVLERKAEEGDGEGRRGFVEIDADSVELYTIVSMICTGRVDAVFLADHLPKLKHTHTRPRTCYHQRVRSVL
ncbi:hypothetical protein BaRGS_00004759 [Batillaria attramentaria]|uniref:Uncharacterized protein n=1 Tax=Batillaria attramentaria TaxID=370345 RepID=A0ABD0LYH5_9CAEN